MNTLNTNFTKELAETKADYEETEKRLKWNITGKSVTFWFYLFIHSLIHLFIHSFICPLYTFYINECMHE